jgi:hypothetical protein
MQKKEDLSASTFVQQQASSFQFDERNDATDWRAHTVEWFPETFALLLHTR